jgi:hypothetical protein
VKTFLKFRRQYGVKDGYSGADFDKTETQDAGGNVQGEYRVNLPDGRVQVTTPQKFSFSDTNDLFLIS